MKLLVDMNLSPHWVGLLVGSACDFPGSSGRFSSAPECHRFEMRLLFIHSTKLIIRMKAANNRIEKSKTIP